MPRHVRSWKAGAVCTVAADSMIAAGLLVYVKKRTGPFADLVRVVGPGGVLYDIPPDFLTAHNPDEAAIRPENPGKFQTKGKQ